MQAIVDGDEMFAFGSNKNISLGFSDQDDRQYPERVFLKRPESLIRRFYEEYLEDAGLDSPSTFDISKVPALVVNKPLMIHDVVLSKLHSAVLTSDPVSNLYVCGIGRGGRLGLGDENTRFNYTPVLGGLEERKVVQVALGQNHTMVITDNGELWTWGSNANSQLGYSLPVPAKKDEEPVSLLPRQLFGPLKKEIVIGIAASSIHSVAHTGTSLYCWGKNVGQLALMDADSRSLEVQQSPRKVAASMFSSPIVMASAIDKATTVLLQNHTVCVFTGYGYTIVRFPYVDAFADHHLVNVSMSVRHEVPRNQIQYITSGGETIAAVTGRGDLFTMGLNHRIDSNLAATSTTNPSKLKGAVTQPQCIWNARKDGVRSVGVGEHGSVIISTESGAVWRRVKRPNAKDSYLSGSEAKRRDFKFQRVPYITKVATVRASTFGAFAATRRDSTVMKEQIDIDEQGLWEDIQSLNSLAGFSASEANPEDKNAISFGNLNMVKERLGAVAYEILRSPDLDRDLRDYLDNWKYQNDPLDAAICTSAEPDMRVPVHGWVLSARSPVLRSALARFRKDGTSEYPDLLSISRDDQEGCLVVTFQGLDIVSLLNLVLYMYEDTLIPVWNFTRQAASLAYRYRQIRVELMKTATRLSMANLESAVRIQTKPARSLDEDLRLAMRDRAFFEDADTLLELDGREVPVHSSLICQRCPWFEGIFHGRSGGLWLAGRKADQGPAERIKIDFKHMDPRAFKYVLQYLYGDFGAEIFDPALCASLDDFLDEVMGVLAIAYELMLDRLSQICQQVMGRFVNTRNIAQLLNEIGPFAITEFKDAGLEYICLQMESMLENHFLDELDQDLLLDLDQVVRENQAAQLRYAKKGGAEERLLEENPGLAQEIDEERQRRVREMAFKVTQRDEEKKLSSSLRAKYGSLEEFLTVTPDKARRASRPGKNEPFSPELRAKGSHVDLMFDMDEDASPIGSPVSKAQRTRETAPALELDHLPPLSESWNDATGKSIPDLPETLLGSPVASFLGRPALQPRRSSGEAASPSSGPAGSPWHRAPVPAAKADLRDILQSEAKPNPQSALTAGLAAQGSVSAERRPSQVKVSQKERKKQQQAQAAQAALLASSPQPKAWDTTAGAGAQASPWKQVSSKGKTTLKEVISAESTPVAAAVSKPLAATGASTPTPRRTASPDTRFSGQSRKANASSTPSRNIPVTSPVSTKSQAPQAPSQPPVPHSKSYISAPPKVQPQLGVSMVDIMGQQQRELEIVKEAVAKRSLQEIQEEQAFQEWWDAESRRTQEEEARRAVVKEKDRDDGTKKAGRRGRGGKPRGGAPAPAGRRGGGGGGGGVTAGGAGSVADAGDLKSAGPPRQSRGRGRGLGASDGTAATAA